MTPASASLLGSPVVKRPFRIDHATSSWRRACSLFLALQKPTLYPDNSSPGHLGHCRSIDSMTPKFLKSGLVPLCLLALCGVANAAEHQPWYGAPDCRIAPVDKPPIDEVRWRGPCKDGYAEGRGVLEWRDDKHVGYALEGSL